MIQGTASGVGKSFLVAGLCRLYTRRGLRVAPFKAVNMSNNAAPARCSCCPAGVGEIGRAQAVQAEACRRPAEVDFNPMLIKPEGGGRAQVVLGGHPAGALGAGGKDPWGVITEAWHRVAANADLVILEGAGSPAEINLRDHDLANMRIAAYADAEVWLVGDIDCGGVFASLYGTMALLTAAERARVTGLVINRFRGDPARLLPGLAPLEALTGVPVRGVVPWAESLRPDEEDAVSLDHSVGALDIAVILLPTVSNTTDLAPLARAPGVGVRWVAVPEKLGNPDLLLIPGAKDTVADLAWLRRVGLDRVIIAAAARGVPMLGICGGYQLLCHEIEERGEKYRGLGLLGGRTEMRDRKVVTPMHRRTVGSWLLPAGLHVTGFEIHQGHTAAPGGRRLFEGDGSVRGLVAGTYLHGLFDEAPLREALLGALWARRGLSPPTVAPDAAREAVYDGLADHLERALKL